MAVVTKGNDGKEPMADDDDRSEREEREQREAERREEAREDAARGAAPSGGVGGGWFSLYKPGQGYWTRMGTAGGAVLLIAMLARFIYISLSTRTRLDWAFNPAKGIDEQGFPKIKLIITAIFCAVSAAVTWYYLNKPKVVDFFIATESEMKKVNWTSRKEIIGSTKVVIGFMFLIAALLFVYDQYFTRIFFLAGVLKFDAPIWDWVGAKLGHIAKTVLDVIVTVGVVASIAWSIVGARKQ
ncbi:MAG TPA: preprotein translocase subunit SecE [Tepidisphaeraceae bacterium]|nr:preprotein translocase subunit SecE [Tepidisphaeraceae bacterium]